MRIGIALAFTVICATLVPVAVRADAQQERAEQEKQACMIDAQTVCGQFIPDRERVAACLMANRKHISAACREALKHFVPRTVVAH